MVPATFTDYFLGSTGASAALIGLLFVAVAVDPERVFGPSATATRRALAVSAFLALLDVFFISLTALIPRTNIGYPAFVLGVSGLVNTLSLARHFWQQRATQRRGQGVTLLLGSVVVYGWQLWFAFPLILASHQTDPVYGLAYLLIGAYAIGVGRAWDLLGAPEEGLLTALSLRRRQDSHDSAAPQPATTQETSAAQPTDRRILTPTTPAPSSQDRSQTESTDGEGI